MELLVAVGILGVLAAVAGVLSILASRRGNTPAHSRALVAGIVSLLSLPVLFLGMVGLMAQLLFASLASLPGLAFLAGFLAALGSTVASISYAVKLRPRPNNSSKPTPLRGAA